MPVDDLTWFYRASRNLETAAFPPCFILFYFFTLHRGGTPTKKMKSNNMLGSTLYIRFYIHCEDMIWHADNDVGCKYIEHEWRGDGIHPIRT